jgi:hypothetical protein
LAVIARAAAIDRISEGIGPVAIVLVSAAIGRAWVNDQVA